ncbi:fungal-specific transcription factor domain-containing protein [Cercophora newfieldiana]|uniref:Fungal-specific transcription factor domain-containing protein n=1 Tax=Cercophora newfieldiana TaxID=92897 RepID=A0AA40CV51_9PEZI|nr:fungal-specific transcription factor domain-containing protein [Cercophora newfieldiana]
MGSQSCELLLLAEAGEKPQPSGPPIRLAWPNANDQRRSVVGKASPLKKVGNVGANNLFIVSVSQRDMEMHYKATDATLHVPLHWSPTVQNVGEQELLQHFQRAASKALVILGHAPSQLGDALIRIALASNGASAGALLKSLLAFSSIHRHDVHSQAVELKLQAIKALGAASAVGEITTPQAIQHVAAGMLLCSFETHQSTCTSGDWQWYLGSVKHIIQTTGLYQVQKRDDNLNIILDWVYYNDVHARFCKQYWHRKPKPLAIARPIPPAHNVRPPSPILTEDSSAGMILTHLLSDVIDAISAAPAPGSPASDIDKYNEYIKILNWRIRNVVIPEDLKDDNGENPELPLVLELYRLAILIYLNRACKTHFQPRTKLQQLIDAAFQLVSTVKICDWQFPIFVIGCEARSDEQRAAIMELMARTEKGGSSRVFNHTPLLMQAMWAQEDLAGGDRTDYNQRLTSVMSCCGIMPTFI